LTRSARSAELETRRQQVEPSRLPLPCRENGIA